MFLQYYGRLVLKNLKVLKNLSTQEFEARITLIVSYNTSTFIDGRSTVYFSLKQITIYTIII